MEQEKTALPAGMTFHFDIVLNSTKWSLRHGVKHSMSGRFYGDCRLNAFSDEEFEQWLQEFCGILDGLVRAEKESTKWSR